MRQFPSAAFGIRPVRPVATLMASAGILALLAGGALAQSPAPEPQGGEIHIHGARERATGPVQGYTARRSATATKTDTPLIETPQSITVIPRQQMVDQGASSVAEALRYTANVIPEARPTSGRYDSVVLRGFGGGGVDANYVGFLDGLRMGRAISYLIPNVEPYGLERIEVLRGPASVLFGQVNPGGLINLVSKRPTETPYREINVQFGSNARKQVGFDFSGPADPEGRFLYRFTGLVRDGDTQVDHVREQRIYFAPSFTFRPNENTSLTVFGKFQRDPAGGFYGALPAVGTVLPSATGRIPTNFFPGEPSFERFSRNLASIGYAFDHRFNEVWSFRSNFRYLDGVQDFATVSARSVSGTTLTRGSVYSREHLRTLAVDNQLEANFTTGILQHKVLIGTDYQQGLSDRGLGQGNAPSINYLNPVYDVPVAMPTLSWLDQYQRQLGFYAQDQIKLDRFVMLLGGRFDSANTSQITRATGARANQADTAWTGRAALLYRFDSGFAPYVSVSTSFDPVSGVSAIAGEVFRPSTGRQYEIGLKYQPDGWRGLVQVALFDLTRQNVLTTAPVPPYATGTSLQIGEVRSRGIEVEARGNVTDNLEVIAAYSYTDAVVTRTSVADSLGKRPTIVPAHAGSIWARYSFLDGPLNGLSLAAGVRYVGAAAGDPANTLIVPAYTLVDAAITYDFGRNRPELKGLSLSVNAHNLFDREYVSGCFSYLGAGCVYGLRRTVTASLTYRW